MTILSSDIRYEEVSLWRLERSVWLIVIVSISSLSLLIYFSWKLRNSILGARKFPPSFSWFSKSSSRLVALLGFFLFECFLIPRLQAFVSNYQTSSHYLQKQPPFPIPSLRSPPPPLKCFNFPLLCRFSQTIILLSGDSGRYFVEEGE